MREETRYAERVPLSISHTELQGEKLILEPLDQGNIEALCELHDPEIWRWYTEQLPTRPDLERFLKNLLREQELGLTFVFAVRDKVSGQYVGCTRYLNLDRTNRRVDIGSTWYAPRWQRTFVNTEAKLLLLSHAFDQLSCICVQLWTDALNQRSRNAIERLGAKLDGIIRAQRICHDGRIRDSAVYSITAPEWPEIKSRLQLLLRR